MISRCKKWINNLLALAAEATAILAGETASRETIVSQDCLHRVGMLTNCRATWVLTIRGSCNVNLNLEREPECWHIQCAHVCALLFSSCCALSFLSHTFHAAQPQVSWNLDPLEPEDVSRFLNLWAICWGQQNFVGINQEIDCFSAGWPQSTSQPISGEIHLAWLCPDRPKSCFCCVLVVILWQVPLRTEILPAVWQLIIWKELSWIDKTWWFDSPCWVFQ